VPHIPTPLPSADDTRTRSANVPPCVPLGQLLAVADRISLTWSDWGGSSRGRNSAVDCCVISAIEKARIIAHQPTNTPLESLHILPSKSMTDRHLRLWAFNVLTIYIVGRTAHRVGGPGGSTPYQQDLHGSFSFSNRPIKRLLAFGESKFDPDLNRVSSEQWFELLPCVGRSVQSLGKYRE